MAVTQITCTNCGAKYKIPETFKGDRAKCKACGSVIDVAAQRTATDQPAGSESAASPSPAAAKPAHAKAVASAKPRHSNRSRSSAKSSRRGHSKTTAKGGNKGMLIGGGLLILAVVVGGVFMMGGEDAPTTEELVQRTAAAAEAKRAAQELENQKEAAAKQAAADKEAKALEAAAAKQAAEAAEAAAKIEKKNKKKEKITSESQVYNPKNELEPVPWPESVTSKEIETITSLVQNIVDGGYMGTKAKKELATVGYKMLPAIVNALREINYLDSMEVMTAWELNKFIDQVTFGVNVGFRPVDIGDAVPLETADWNAKIVKTWRKFAISFDNQEAWDKMMKRNEKNQRK